MNIHFTDAHLHQQLQQSCICQIEFGSSLYQLSTDQSDKDVLCLYAQGRDNLSSSLTYEHHLQYKHDNVDYIYVSIDQFVKSLIKGSSTIFFEVLHTTAFKDAFNQLHAIRQYFYHNKMMDAYLGLAKRDFKLAKKEHVIHGSKHKKLSHCMRGLYAFDDMLKGIYTNSLYHIDRERWEYLKQLKEGQIVNEANYLSVESDIQQEVDSRINLFDSTIKHSNTHSLTVAQLIEINDILVEIYRSEQVWAIQLDKIDSDALFADSMINGVTY